MFEFLKKEEKDIQKLLKRVVSLHFDPLFSQTDSKTLQKRVQPWIEEEAKKRIEKREPNAN